MRRPNILVLMTDQQRADSIHQLGATHMRTPVLDRLCAEGTAFDRAYTPSPVCVPARCALATGLAPWTTGVTDNHEAPAEGTTSLMQRLDGQGYRCHGVGKMHFTPEARALWGFAGRDFSEEGHEHAPYDDYLAFLHRQGYGHIRDPHGVRSEYYYLPQPSQVPAHLHHTAWTADRAIDFLDRRSGDAPFFLFVSFIRPHPPFDPPYPWSHLYRAAGTAPPRQVPGQEELWTFWNRVQNRYKYRDQGYDAALARTMRAAYQGNISFIDHAIGRILERLGGGIDDTLVLFTSDHGELLGDYGCHGKRSFLDAAARIPLIARLPGRFPAGLRCPTPASLLDIAPTVLSAVSGTEVRLSPDGEDLASLPGRADRTVFGQFQSGRLGLYAAMDRRWKYVWSAPDQRAWLFDRELDSEETRDWSGNPLLRPQVEGLGSALRQRLREAGRSDAVSGQEWTSHPRMHLPPGDTGLLFQDAPGLEAALAGLGAGYGPGPASGREPMAAFTDLLGG